jgi:hypothetical protein
MSFLQWALLAIWEGVFGHPESVVFPAMDWLYCLQQQSDPTLRFWRIVISECFACRSSRRVAKMFASHFSVVLSAMLMQQSLLYEQEIVNSKMRVWCSVQCVSTGRLNCVNAEASCRLRAV